MHQIIITAFFLFVSSVSLACTCAQRSTSELIDNASTIYVGRATKSELINDSIVKTTFEIERVFKGSAKDKYFVFSDFSSAVCGIEYSVGHSYLVLANKDKRVSICTGHEEYYPIVLENRADVVDTGILKELRKNDKHNH